MSSTAQLIATTVGGTIAGAGGLAGLLRVRPQNRRTEADSAKVLAQAYALFVDDLRSEMNQLRSENNLLRERIASLEAHISGLLQERRDKI